MNVADPFYIGALPSVVQFCVGLGAVTLVGWLLAPRKKR